MSVKKVSLKGLAKYLKTPWVPIVLGSVEDYEVKLVEYKGEYYWHKHEKHDEFMYVYRGRVSIELKKGKEVNLNPGEGALIEKCTVHRSKSKRKSLVIVFERKTIYADFVKV